MVSHFPSKPNRTEHSVAKNSGLRSKITVKKPTARFSDLGHRSSIANMMANIYREKLSEKITRHEKKKKKVRLTWKKFIAMLMVANSCRIFPPREIKNDRTATQMIANTKTTILEVEFFGQISQPP